jgi:hypothetical protein
LYRAISYETSAAVNRKKNEVSYTSYTLKEEKQEQKQRLNSTYMYILSDIYVISVVDMLKCLDDHTYGVMLSMPSSGMVDSGFESWSGLTKYSKIGIRCFFAMHAALRSKNKDVLLGIRIMFHNRATCLPIFCCF